MHKKVKITAPKTLNDYICRTEHAVKHLYAGLDSCKEYYTQAQGHWDITQINEPMTAERKATLDEYLQLSSTYFELKLSEAMFAGGILQMAYMAIRLYSRNNIIPESCANIVRPKQKTALPFCIGRELYGFPVGLIIYAGRNQFSHWDDEEPHEITRSVFDALSISFRVNPWSDLAFSLSNPSINVYANEVLQVALQWHTYETYIAELQTLLESALEANA